MSHFNKIRTIFCVNTHIQSVKVWLKCVLPWLKCSIFLGDCFFIGAPCTTINFANTWKDMAPLKLLHFGEFKTAVYAFQQIHTLSFGQGHSQ